MQLLDPSAIKRDKSYALAAEEGGKGEEEESLYQIASRFDKVQKIYDAVTLQEELKHVLSENIQLKEKIREMEDDF